MNNLNDISESSIYKLSNAIHIETSLLSVDLVDKMHGHNRHKTGHNNDGSTLTIIWENRIDWMQPHVLVLCDVSTSDTEHAFNLKCMCYIVSNQYNG